MFDNISIISGIYLLSRDSYQNFYLVERAFEGKPTISQYGFTDFIAAPLASELGEELKELKVTLPGWDRVQKHWFSCYTKGFEPDWFCGETEANARAKMWLYLKSEGLL